MKREALLATIAIGLLRLVFLTIRLRVKDESGVSEHTQKGPILMCFWHNRILGIALTFLRRYPHKVRHGVTVLTSPSKDGEILAQAMDRLGMGSVRGSSSRRGSQALRELVRLVENGGDIAITPDGPRGPRYSLGPGVLLLSQTTGAPIVPMHASFSRAIRLKTWDGFIIPLPFSTVSVNVDRPIPIPPNLTKEEFEAMRVRLETILKNEAD
jgi:lysophospholipid acyltransferase (LPLAT)-like uncharacterized protein